MFDGLALWATAQAELADGAIGEAVPLLEEAHRLTAGDLTWAGLPPLTLAQVAADLDDPGAAEVTLHDAERLAEAGGLVWIAGRLAAEAIRRGDR